MGEKVEKFTKQSLAACPMVLGDAAVFVRWPGSLPEAKDVHILHYWGPWDTMVKQFASRFRPSGPGHQYLVLSSQRELLQRVGQIIEEVRRVAGTLSVRAWRGPRDVEEPLLAASRGSDEGPLRRGTALLEGRVEVVVKGGILSIESVPANAYRRLEEEMARSPLRADAALWKETSGGPLLGLRPGEALHIATDPEGAGVIMAEHNWDDRASGAAVLKEARSSSKGERVVGTLTVGTGMLVMAKAALSHHVLVPRAKDPLAAFRALLAGGTTAELELPKLGKVGHLVALAPGPYDVLLGSTKTVRWCRMRTGQGKRKS